MDPLTQGVLGAVLAQTGARPKEVVTAGWLGFVSGMAADLDVLIRSAADPLLFLEYHRQFTHSLLFIPIGGLLCALVLHRLIARPRGLSFGRTLLFCALGYATHGLLDACTSYGTQLLWPFSTARIAWNTISIIDPLFTVPLLLLAVLAARCKRAWLAHIALAWGCAYMSLGWWQHEQAITMGQEIAASRGHTPQGVEAKPSFGNILVWKIIYQTSDRFYVDAVRVGWSARVFYGRSLARLNIARDLPWLRPDSQQAADVERFRWFSDGYIALDPVVKNRLVDMRYSMIPNDIAALWSIELAPDAGQDAHVQYRSHRTSGGDALAALWAMMVGGL